MFYLLKNVKLTSHRKNHNRADFRSPQSSFDKFFVICAICQGRYESTLIDENLLQDRKLANTEYLSNSQNYGLPPDMFVIHVP